MAEEDKLENVQLLIIYHSKQKSTQATHYMSIQNVKKSQQKFGFITNPKLSHWDNTKNILRVINTKIFFSKTSSLAYYNLCTKLNHQLNLVPYLLGLGLNLYTKTIKPDKDSFSIAFNRIRRDMIIKYCFSGGDNNDFNPWLYIKSKWNHDNTSSDIEQQIDKFEQTLISIRNDFIRITRIFINTSIQEHHLLKVLPWYSDFIVVNMD